MDTYPHFDRPAETENEWFEALMSLARYLRTPEGCPWDREQDAKSFAEFAKDEVDEYIEALDENDSAHIAEEFGDAFFTLLASGAAAEEEGHFDLKDALEAIHDKMIRRHDHVFGETKAASAEDAIKAWEVAKAKERGEG
jgi:tetrapyrrole methylase family protein / MazG family protein